MPERAEKVVNTKIMQYVFLCSVCRSVYLSSRLMLACLISFDKAL